MAVPSKYQAKEVLNKVLNSGEDALNVDLSDSVTVTVDSEFPAAATITDNFANPTTTSAMSMLMGYDGSTWDRVTIGGGAEAAALRVTIASDSTGVVTVDDGGGALTVDGTVTANLSATDNAVLDAMVVDLAAMETLLTAANVDHAANEVLLGTIDSDTNDIKTATEASNTHLGNMFYDTAQDVTPHDTNDLANEPFYAVWVGTGGNLKVDMCSGTGTVTLNNVASGQLLPIMVERIYATGTTASNIIVFK